MKISIRTGILVLFASIFIITGTIIISADHYTEDKILIKNAAISTKLFNSKIENAIFMFLQPLYQRSVFTGKLIDNEIFIPGKDIAKTTKFLLPMFFNYDGIVNATWCNPDGECIIITQQEDGSFVRRVITQNEQGRHVVETEISNTGEPLGKAKHYRSTFDVRKRNWYKKTLEKRKQVLSEIYTFYPLGKGNKPIPGVTATYPVYTKENGSKLLGIIALDLNLENFSSFISKLKITENSFTFIGSRDGNVIAANQLPPHLVNKLPKIKQIEKPWVIESFNTFKKNNKYLFLYKYAGKLYLASYKDIQYAVHNLWFIATIIPAEDIIGEAHATNLKLTLVAIAILLLGMIAIWFAAGAIARPIIKLTEEADAIKNLEMPIMGRIKSLLREINYLQETFNSMKQSLGSFARYVPKALVQKLVASGDVAHVGGESKKLTVMFTDIKNFTSIAESMDPEVLMKYLSEYFEAMTKIILDKKGTLDKYIGDAIMAFWGAPIADSKQAIHACKSAILMMAELQRLNQQWRKNNLPELHIRIGIHTGKAVVGNVGSDYKLSYTSLGDNVNLTSRLEELNKLYGTKIIISNTTYQLIKDIFPARLLDNVAVRGKQEGVYIYELLTPDNPLLHNLPDYNTGFFAAFAAYQQSKWKTALKLFRKLHTDYPDDTLLEMYIERCNLFQKNPPTSWQGIWRI